MTVLRVALLPSARGLGCVPASFFSSFARQAPAYDGPPPRGNSDQHPPLSPPDWASLGLPPVNKQTYKPLVEYSDQQIEQWRNDNKIRVQYRHAIPAPLLSFGDCEWPGSIYQKLQSSGISTPTPVQAQGFPLVLSGADMVGVAQTGSGKTLAYTLPAIVHLLAQQRVNRRAVPGVLVLAPTRELVQQINSVVQEYTRSLPAQLRTVCLYGGASRNVQCGQLARGCDIAIATPGRLIDVMNTSDISLRLCSFLVLDEADRMLDMGFKPQITSVVQQIRPDRQTVMWSATWPKEVRALSSEFMLQDYALLSIGAAEDGLVANADITQHVHICSSEEEKLPRLLHLLSGESGAAVPQRVLVFAATCRRCDWLWRALHERLPTRRPVIVHGQCSQRMRNEALTKFREGRSGVLVATDVAARGLDIPDVDMVINFDYPNTSSDYIHRIGRTGRCGRQGVAHTLLTEQDSAHMPDLVHVLRRTNQAVPEELQHLADTNTRRPRTFQPRSSGNWRGPHRGGHVNYSRGNYSRGDNYSRGNHRERFLHGSPSRDNFSRDNSGYSD